MLLDIPFAFIAGTLSILSPCVLPILPIVLAGATAQGRFGVVWLAAGLALSFTGIGLFVAIIGFSAGIDSQFFRILGASIMIGLGVVLVVPMLQVRAATAMGPMSDWAERRMGGFSTDGSSGQFALGLLLGTVWAPCVGPTLGAASVMAARGENLSAVAATMLAFGIGAALPLLLLGTLSHSRIVAWRQRLMAAGSGAKSLMGAMLIALGVAIVTGLDKIVETKLVYWSPDWLTRLTTAF
jgi:cytochrome c-type biogenesis protein